MKMSTVIEFVYFISYLQFRENVAAWVCFHDRKDAFKGFLGRVLRLKSVLMRPKQLYMRSWVKRGVLPCLCQPHFGD
ncbi:hypothetical protein RchiOBHm_Chr1g0320381 [Rosa chinensis]|uniref:Uncharacterized protein n=1 Tax=Rosa chinensis TaxID=74649 RepID=A0A2P6S8R0_ROSCH|nr:hypothetical protein RchiOBHm_Chr1g0320381 [Rosa chinensis]